MEQTLVITSDKTFNTDIRDDLTSRMVDVAIAAIFMIPASVIIATIYFLYLLKIKDGGPFFYKNYRLGKDRHPFNCLKIRTLVFDAEKRIGSKIYQGHEKLDLWYGKFLRKTRIDELPQLVNILRGEMSFIGPRPVRPIQYEQLMSNLTGIEKHFSVRPGLTGYSQFLTPSGVNKKIRAKVDAYFYSRKIPEFQKLQFVIWTAYRCCFLVIRETVNSLFQKTSMISRGKIPKDHRLLHREYPRNINGFFYYGKKTSGKEMFSVRDISNSTMRISTPVELVNHEAVPFLMGVENYKNGNKRVNWVECKGNVIIDRSNVNFFSGDNCYIIQYKAKSEYHKYIIEKYLLKASLA